MTRHSVVRFGYLALLLLLAGRVVWVCIQTETGFETIRMQWRDATVGVFLGNYKYVSYREPPDQAEFWLDKTSDLKDTNSTNSALLMGAALILDSPHPGYIRTHLQVEELSNGLRLVVKKDESRIEALEEAFESSCKDVCLDLAFSAARANPDNKPLWQWSALLLRRSSLHSSDNSLRTPDWRERLEEAASHDSENALYDYLAAEICWDASREYDFSTPTATFHVLDETIFDEVLKHFRDGLAKPKFLVDNTSLKYERKFLNAVQISATEQSNLLNTDHFALRRAMLLRELCTIQDIRADNAIKANDFSLALQLIEQNLRILDQFQSSSLEQKYDGAARILRSIAASRLVLLIKDRPAEFSDQQLAEATQTQVSAREADNQVAAANQDSSNSWIQSFKVPRWRQDLLVLNATISAALPRLLFLLCCFAAFLYLVRRRQDRPIRPVAAAYWHLPLFLLSILFTFSVYGLAPAQIISAELQGNLFSAALVGTPIIVGGTIVWILIRRASFQFNLGSMLIAVTGFAIVFGLISKIYQTGGFSDFPVDVSVPARNIDGVDSTVAEHALRGGLGGIQVLGWAVTQWNAYQGQMQLALVWTFLSAILIKLKSRKFDSNNEVPGDQPGYFCQWARFQYLGFSKISGILLLFYLLAIPAVIKQSDEAYMEAMQRVNNPDSKWLAIERGTESKPAG